MPEGDALHRAAQKLQVLVGERLEAEAPHPRAAGLEIADRIDGRRLLSARAVGKNQLLEFEDGLVVREAISGCAGAGASSVAGPSGSAGPGWCSAGPSRRPCSGTAPVLELERGRLRRLGPDILAAHPIWTGWSRISAAALEAERSARDCSTNGSWPGIGNIYGAPRRSGSVASLRGERSRPSPTQSFGTCSDTRRA